jgi:hypothetical protein
MKNVECGILNSSLIIAKKGEKAERPTSPTWDDADLSDE